MAHEELKSIRIDLSDWVKEAKEKQVGFTTLEGAYQYGAQEGLTARQVSRLCHTQQRLGKMDENIFDPDGKGEFSEGVYQRFLKKAPMVRLTRTIPISTGGEKEEVIGKAHAYPAGGQEGIVDGASELGTQNALNYLYGPCVGHVRRMQTRLALNKQDVRAITEELCGLLRENAEEIQPDVVLELA